MTRKTQRTHEFKIRVHFDKPVSATVARRELRGAVVGLTDFCVDDCPADTLLVLSVTPLPKEQSQ